MPQISAGLISKALAIYAKDLRLELRSRYAVNTILMFSITTLAVVSYSLGQGGLSPRLLSALYWIIMFFSSMAGLAQVFIREEEAGTSLVLRLTAEPNAVYLGKLFFNLTLLLVMTVIITPLFFIFMDVPVDNVLLFVLMALFAVIALCSATTLVAAIIARAAVKGTLFAVVAFPIIIVPMMVLVTGGAKVLDGGSVGDVSAELQLLVAYSGVMITASILLFRFVWQE